MGIVLPRDGTLSACMKGEAAVRVRWRAGHPELSVSALAWKGTVPGAALRVACCGEAESASAVRAVAATKVIVRIKKRY